MSDYIKREDAYSACCYETLECYMARKEIKALPSADVAPVRHGRWIKNDPHCDGLAFLWNCSECGAESDEGYIYCPYCGARMDEGEDNEII